MWFFVFEKSRKKLGGINMKENGTKQLVLSGVFIALGIVLPMAFHLFGGGGPMFLPMHIPVLLAGFFLSMPYAIAVGIITPLLSSLFTGMPPMFPVLPYMMLELATYACMVSFLYQKKGLNVYISLIGSMIAGRIMAGLGVWILAQFFAAKMPGPIVFITGAISKGLPGIIIQIIFIPILIIALQKNNLVSQNKKVA